MQDLCFYIVDSHYIHHLQQCEISQRGFTRVPNVEYGENRKPKFLCGVVFQIGQMDYFVPVSSYKLKRPDNFTVKVNGKIVSSLRFNYMVPCPKSVLTLRNIPAEPDLKYRLLLVNELDYCRKYQSYIRRAAERTYLRVTKGLDPNLVKNSCDFLLLEQACHEYGERQVIQPQQPSQNKPLSFADQLADAKRQASELNRQRQAQPPVPGRNVPERE